MINASDKAQGKSAHEKELEKVVVNKEDIDVLVAELELTRPLAERSLREHGGDLKQTLKALLNK